MMVWIGVDCIHCLNYERLVGVPLRGDDVSYFFAPVRLGKLDFYTLAVIMGYIGLVLAGWDRRTGLTGWDRGGMEGPELAGAGLGAPSLAIEVRRAEGSGVCHQFIQCFRGRRVSVSVQQNNHNTLHTNPNC